MKINDQNWIDEVIKKHKKRIDYLMFRTRRYKKDKNTGRRDSNFNRINNF
jgi:hypothetical protein